MEAYLDIETTGLSACYHQITVVGIAVGDARRQDVVQLVGRDVTRRNLLRALEGVRTLYTYNGSRFDLPFLTSWLGIDLLTFLSHRDLMLDCWSQNLYGGLKKVEQRLGIARRLADINGYDAVRLWMRYVDYRDQDALLTLLEYNKEDVLNLKVLKERLLG